jgi:hypothetical protein
MLSFVQKAVRDMNAREEAELLGVKGAYLDEYCDHCASHAPPFKTLPRCDRCKIAKYCSKECQHAARSTHKNFCHEPSFLSEREQQAVRERIKLGQVTPAPVKVDEATIADHHWGLLPSALPREFVLASGERVLAISGAELPFSIFSLPDHFEWAWPMHKLLPNELAPLNAQFMCTETMHELRKVSGRPLSASGKRESKIFEGAVAKFVKNVPRLNEAMQRGQPEAATLWKNGCTDMCCLLHHRWAFDQASLPQFPPIAVVPVAPRPYELHPEVQAIRTTATSADGASGHRLRVLQPYVQQGANFFVLRMPDSPFDPARGPDTPACVCELCGG